MKWRGSGQKRWLALAVAALLAGLGVVGWIERDGLRAWWVLRGLRQADEAQVGAWADRVANLGEPALPGLLTWLSDGTQADALRAEAALMSLSRNWPAEDPRRAELAQRLTRAYARLSPAGQCAVLNTGRAWLDEAKGPGTNQASRLLIEAARPTEAAVLGCALRLGGPLIERGADAECCCAARSLAHQGLRSDDPAIRLLAAELAGQPSLDLKAELVPLLRDPVAEVRQAALRTLGSAIQVLPTDALLPLLHDPDEGARRLCERALRQRGLDSDYIRLARLVTDPRWSSRLEVIEYLEDAADLGLDPVVWLRRLTHDPAAAVRVAAVRAAGEAALAPLADRLEQMAHDDPSATVRELAQHYRRPLRGQRP